MKCGRGPNTKLLLTFHEVLDGFTSSWLQCVTILECCQPGTLIQVFGVQGFYWGSVPHGPHCWRTGFGSSESCMFQSRNKYTVRWPTPPPQQRHLMKQDILVALRSSPGSRGQNHTSASTLPFSLGKVNSSLYREVLLFFSFFFFNSKSSARKTPSCLIFDL